MKPYIFNGNGYTDLNELAMAYKENFNLGVEDIYTNGKKLVKFIKQVSKDKELVKTIVNYIAYSTYKNNALTFIIFELSDNKEVVINGQVVTFEEYIKLLKKYPNDKENNILFGFLKDHGISKLYERLDPTNNFFNDIYYAERNYNTDFVYLYLTQMMDYDVTEQQDSKITSIAIGNEECFRRATKLVKSDDFMLWFCKRYGLKAATIVSKEDNPLFYAVKYLSNLVDENELKKLISDTYFWWMYDNYLKYEYKGKAKIVLNRFNDIKKEYESTLQKINKKEGTKISLEFYSETSRKLYFAYKDFLIYYKKGLIKVAKGLDEAQFTPDKPYAKTYITADYMKGRVIKLATHTDEPVQTINPLTGEVIIRENKVKTGDIDDVSDDMPVDMDINLDSTSDFDKIRKKNKKLSRFVISSIILTIILLGLSVFFILMGSIDFVNLFNITDENIKTVFASIKAAGSLYNIIALAMGAVAFAFCLAIVIVKGQREDAINDYEFYQNASKMDELDLKQEERYNKIENNLDKVVKKISMNIRLLPFLELVAFTLCASFANIAFGAIACVIMNKDFSVMLSDLPYRLIVFLSPMVLAMIIGYFKKNKGVITNLFFVFLTLALSFGLAFVF